MQAPKGGWEFLMSLLWLEFQGCHLILLPYLLSCYSAKSCFSCLFLFLVLAHSPICFPEISCKLFFLEIGFFQTCQFSSFQLILAPFFFHMKISVKESKKKINLDGFLILNVFFCVEIGVEQMKTECFGLRFYADPTLLERWVSANCGVCSLLWWVCRFRGPMPPMPPQRQQEGDDDNTPKRPAIVSEKDLKEFDEILRSEAGDGGWAGAQGEIDYRSVGHASGLIIMQ